MEYKKTLQLQAYEYIKSKILNNDMLYNKIYSETKIAKELGISRTPVRDAIQYLSQERYIDIIPNKGFCLHKMQMQDFIDTMEIRTAIEGYCVRKIAKEYESQKAKYTLKKLEELIEIQKKSVNISLEDFFESDMLFHITIVNHINNNELKKLFSSYIYRMRNFAMHSLSHEGRIKSTIEEHLEILNNMKEGNAINAYESTVLHMENPKDISVDDIYNI